MRLYSQTLNPTPYTLNPQGYNAAEYLIDTLNQHDVETGGTHDFAGCVTRDPKPVTLKT